MSTVIDLLHLSDRLFAIIKRRDSSDVEVFRESIDPLFAQVEVVVRDMLNMYQPVAAALLELITLQTAEFNARLEALHTKTFGRKKSPTEVERAEYQTAVEHLEKELPIEFFSQHKSQFVRLVSSFKQRRRKTRHARIKADAAACALAQHYETRSNEFSVRVREFASQIRVIVGRAHNRPIHHAYNRQIPGTQFCQGLLETLLASFPRTFSYTRRTFNERFPEMTLTAGYEQEAEQRISRQSSPELEILRLLGAVRDICSEIRQAWENTIYIYAILRLAVISQGSGRHKTTSET